MKDFTLDEVRNLLIDTTSKEDLIKLANERFGHPLGSLRSASRKKILDKLNVSVKNEEVHNSIARLCKK